MSSEWPPGRYETGDRNGRRSTADPDHYHPAGPGEDTAEWQRVDWPGTGDTGSTGRFNAFDPPRPDISGSWDRGFGRRSEPEPDDSDAAPLVRPYARTGGRTRASQDLALETLVSVTDQGRVSAPLLSADQAAICGLCEAPISVAEVGARLRVPLGVARVLLSDLASSGLITVHDSAVHAGNAPSLDFMERVLVGLRNL